MTSPTPAPDANNRQVLQDLIDMGADIARMLHRQAQAQAEASPEARPEAPPRGPAPETVAAFDRIARAIRRGILLARHLDQPPQLNPGRDPARRRIAARKQIIRGVEDSIQWNGKSGEQADSLHAELLERLESAELDEDLDDRTAAELIAEICHDLGLGAPDGLSPWRRRTPDDLAELQARAAAPRPAERRPPKRQAAIHPLRPPLRPPMSQDG